MDNSYEATMRPWYVGTKPAEEEARLPALDNAAIVTANRLAVAAHALANEQLKQELLGRIYCQSHQFFESLVLDVLLAMGYAGRRRDLAKHLGRSHDGGVDGVIALDELGLDAIYVQAKRLKLGSAVPVADVRNFVGSLEANRASKGVFLTTGHFTQPAEQFTQSVHRRIVLIDGNRLAELMIRHNVGVAVSHSYQTKAVVNTYFSAGVT